jgi:hypothetical protein
MKALLKKTEGEKAFRRALLHQRNTPRSDGAESPAELFFGRTMRRGLPVIEEGKKATAGRRSACPRWRTASACVSRTP